MTNQSIEICSDFSKKLFNWSKIYASGKKIKTTVIFMKDHIP